MQRLRIECRWKHAVCPFCTLFLSGFLVQLGGDDAHDMDKNASYKIKEKGIVLVECNRRSKQTRSCKECIYVHSFTSSFGLALTVCQTNTVGGMHAYIHAHTSAHLHACMHAFTNTLIHLHSKHTAHTHALRACRNIFVHMRPEFFCIFVYM